MACVVCDRTDVELWDVEIPIYISPRDKDMRRGARAYVTWFTYETCSRCQQRILEASADFADEGIPHQCCLAHGMDFYDAMNNINLEALEEFEEKARRFG